MLMLLVFAVCTVAPSPAPAQNGLGVLADKVSVMDRNFDAADRNHDGLLSRDEAKAGHVPFIVSNFDAIDVAKRGLVSKDEVHAFIRRSLMREQPAPAASTR
jgi:hypothetical protein